MNSSSIVIVGAGAWGSALAVSLAHDGREVTLVANSKARASEIESSRKNDKRLKDIALPTSVIVTDKLEEALGTSDHLLLAVPTAYLRELLQRVSAGVGDKNCILCAKGMDDGMLPYEMAQQFIADRQIFVLSGPNLAHEVGILLPTASVLASSSMEQSLWLARLLGHKFFRLYGSDDPLGCSLGGAMKNVFAIGSALIEGRRLGENARAAFITRGQAEMMRLAAAMGAQKETMNGLAGYGDLCLTSYSRYSRNWQLGFAIGQGMDVAQALQKVQGVCEGFHSVLSLEKRAKELHCTTPLMSAVAAILHRSSPIEAVLDELLARPFTTE